MRIGIIGAGNVGGALGRLWADGGHDVMFGVRDPSQPAGGGLPKVRSGSVAEAATFGDVILLAVPWEAARDAVTNAGSITGKTLIDATNPLLPELAGLAIGTTTSASEQIAGWAAGARVVKCFNTLGAQNLASPNFPGGNASMFLCGDDQEAKDIVRQLGEELGFDMVDTGPLTQARWLEAMAMLWIAMAYKYGMGTRMAFKLLR